MIMLQLLFNYSSSPGHDLYVYIGACYGLYQNKVPPIYVGSSTGGRQKCVVQHRVKKSRRRGLGGRAARGRSFAHVRGHECEGWHRDAAQGPGPRFVRCSRAGLRPGLGGRAAPGRSKLSLLSRCLEGRLHHDGGRSRPGPCKATALGLDGGDPSILCHVAQGLQLAENASKGYINQFEDTLIAYAKFREDHGRFPTKGESRSLSKWAERLRQYKRKLDKGEPTKGMT
jgi:hypothetical protein